MFELFQKGGLMMWPLLAASLVSMTVVIERIFFVLKQKTFAQVIQFIGMGFGRRHIPSTSFCFH